MNAIKIVSYACAGLNVGTTIYNISRGQYGMAALTAALAVLMVFQAKRADEL